MSAGFYVPGRAGEASRPGPGLPVLVPAAAMAGACVVSLGLLVFMGLWALTVPLYLAVGAVCVFRPGTAAAGLAFLAVALEPGAVDWTDVLGRTIWLGPPGIDTMPVGPLEVLLVAVTGSLWWRRGKSRDAGLPAVAWLVPAVLITGFLYGFKQGAQPNVAYHEARGLIFATVAFAAYRLLAPADRLRAAKAVLAGSAFMAVTLIARYVFVVAPGRTDVPIERVFTHEGPVVLAICLVAGAASFVKERAFERRLALLLYCLLLAGAIFVTGRRAGTLALLVGGAVFAWYLVPRRPGLVGGMTAALLVIGAMYLAMFWSTEYGALAQPARAVRSQFDPSVRDFSSDRYREIEVHNVVATIETNPLWGVGFGKPFGQFRPLPDLTAWWPLQLHVAHEGILWLWLKTGAVGVITFLSLWVIAVARCAGAMRAARGIPVLGVTAAAGLFVVFAFANVDTVLAETRGAVLVAVTLSIALAVPMPGRATR